MITIEAVTHIALRRQDRGLLAAAAGAGDGPAVGGQTRRERPRRIAEPETEQMPARGGHERRSAEAAASSGAAQARLPRRRRCVCA